VDEQAPLCIDHRTEDHERQLSSVMGCLLILVGIGLVVFHIFKVLHAPILGTAKVGPTGIEPRTSYPGILLIAIGAAMVMVGAATSN
jgi:hypothetical protein